MVPIYKIHPGIGIARLGNSPDKFCISPEKPTALPIDCDAAGNPLRAPNGTEEMTIKKFKDDQGRIKRQAARFQVYAYNADHPEGIPLKIGDRIEGGGNHGTLVNIYWRIHLANKKATWFEFKQREGEHGYLAGHPLRNASITDENARQQLIIDAGPRIVNGTDRRRARFGREGEGVYAPTFPPALHPNSIDSLGDLLTDDQGRLLVLGGHGNSGCFKDGFGHPRIDDYANNDGWFDDVSDGPVMARLAMFSEEVQSIRFIDVEAPAWVVVGYPAYVPAILDMITMDEVIYNMAITQFAWRRDLYTDPKLDQGKELSEPLTGEALAHWRASAKKWNRQYKVRFYRDVWPILFRPDEFNFVCNILLNSNAPHNKSDRGTFDPARLGVPPEVNQHALQECEQQILADNAGGNLFVSSAEPQVWRTQSQWADETRATIAELDSKVPAAKIEALLKEVFDGTDQILHMEIEPAVKKFIAEWVKRNFPVNEKTRFQDYLESWIDWEKTNPDAYQKGRSQLEKAVRGWVAELETKVLTLIETATHPEEFQPFREPLTGDAKEFLLRKWSALIHDTASNFLLGKILSNAQKKAALDAIVDPYRDMRTFLYSVLRQSGEENRFQYGDKPNSRVHNLPLMPLLAGDNPLSNTAPSKFLRLTDYQLYILRQWAEGMFYNEEVEGWEYPDPLDPFSDWKIKSGAELDRSVLSNLLGGAFCPGGELCWIIRNPAIYTEPYRIKADPEFSEFAETAANSNTNMASTQALISAMEDDLSQSSNFQTGLQPGDLTKYSALPWQADFNECSTQTINLTYEDWNNIDPKSEDDPIMAAQQKVWEAMWWPGHRPLQTYEVTGFGDSGPNYAFLDWSRGIPQTNAGDLKMVTHWSELGFVIDNPYISKAKAQTPSVMGTQKYISVERNNPSY